MPGTAVVADSRAQSRSGQQHTPDLVQHEVVRAQVGSLSVHGRDGPVDVLGQPQQDERQLRVRFRPPGDSGAATRLQRQEVVEAPLHLLERQRRTGREQVRHEPLLTMTAVRLTASYS
ncbi:hypothetical protein ACLQ2E_27835 [Streptomyces lavendulocolor]